MDWFRATVTIIVLVAVLSGVLSVLKRLLTGRPGDWRYPWWSRSARGDPADDTELAELRQAIERLTEEVADVKDRLGGEVTELQERLDFAERMLAQQRERAALPER